MKECVVAGIIAVMAVIIVVLGASLVVMSDRASYHLKEVEVCIKVINDFKEQYPDYVDTVTGSDEWCTYVECIE